MVLFAAIKTRVVLFTVASRCDWPARAMPTEARRWLSCPLGKQVAAGSDLDVLGPASSRAAALDFRP